MRTIAHPSLGFLSGHSDDVELGPVTSQFIEVYTAKDHLALR